MLFRSGVFHPDLTGIQVRVLQALGAQHALVVHGLDGIDEITLGAPTLVAELKDGQIHEYEVRPEDFGLTRAPLEALRIATPAESVALIHQVLDNQPGPARDVVALNAGGTLYAAGVAPSLAAGVQCGWVDGLIDEGCGLAGAEIRRGALVLAPWSGAVLTRP